MKLRPIIFRGDMVRAILAGTKTQTRRIVKLREFDRSGTPGYDWTFRDREARWHDFRDADFLARKCPYEETNRLDASAVQNWCFARRWVKRNRGVEGDAQAREVILLIAEACRG